MNFESPTTRILGIPISRLGFESAMQMCRERVAERKGGYVCFANVHSVTESLDHPDLRKALTGSFLSLADGLPLVWISRIQGESIESRVCGPDFMPEFLQRFPDLKHAFIGGADGVGEAIALRFGLAPWVYSPPMRPFSPENAENDWKTLTAQKGDGALPEVVWVGLGAPKQEYWMKTVSNIAPETLFFGVGAAFDFLAATKKRAPKWMQKMGLEWCYRIICEPRRLWRRYFKTNTKFLLSLFSDRSRL